MRLLVVGANGLLGSNVANAGIERNWRVSGTYHSTRPDFDIPLEQYDIREYESFDEILSTHEPDAVINCAAMTDVDGCEEDSERARLINGEAPGGLAAHCDAQEVEFIHISTDYVFDGNAREPYDEMAETNPVQTYGQSKLTGERRVNDQTDALVARLSFVWGIHRNSGDLTGFPAWVSEKLQSGERIPLFTDQWVTPTRAGQAAETLLELIESGTTGLFNIACSSCVTPYQFGTEIAEYVGDGDLIEEGSMADIDRQATRPTYTCLATEKLESTLDRSQPTLQEDVETVESALRQI